MTPLEVLQSKVEARREALKREMANINARLAQLDERIHQLHEEMACIQRMSGQRLQSGLSASVLQQNSHRISECHQHLAEFHRAREKLIYSKKEVQEALQVLDGKFKSFEKRMKNMNRQKLSDAEKAIQKELDDIFAGRWVFRD